MPAKQRPTAGRAMKAAAFASTHHATGGSPAARTDEVAGRSLHAPPPTPVVADLATLATAANHNGLRAFRLHEPRHARAARRDRACGRDPARCVRHGRGPWWKPGDIAGRAPVRVPDATAVEA